MSYRVTDEFGLHLGDVFIPWDELREFKASVFCSIGFGWITFH